MGRQGPPRVVDTGSHRNKSVLSLATESSLASLAGEEGAGLRFAGPYVKLGCTVRPLPAADCSTPPPNASSGRRRSGLAGALPPMTARRVGFSLIDSMREWLVMET